MSLSKYFVIFTDSVGHELGKVITQMSFLSLKISAGSAGVVSVAKKWTHLKGLIHSHVWQLILAVDCQLENVGCDCQPKNLHVTAWAFSQNSDWLTDMRTARKQNRST